MLLCRYDSCSKYELPDSTLTKCWRVGAGGDQSFHRYGFSVEGSNKSSQIDLAIYASRKPLYIEIESEPADVQGCFVNGTVSPSRSCYWDQIFSRADPSDLSPDIQDEASMIEIQVPNGPLPAIGYLFEAFPRQAFATYSVDPSMLTPAFQIVQTIDLSGPEDVVQPFEMHPTWILAAWGVANGSTVRADHASLSGLQSAILGKQESILSGASRDEVVNLKTNPPRY